MKKNIFFVLCFSFGWMTSGCAPAGTSEIQQTESPIENTEIQQAEFIPAQILLFNGLGTSQTDWQSLVNIIKSMGLTYSLVSSYGLNNMTLSQLATYKLILIPGGDSNVIVRNLTLNAKINVRKAVRDYGVSFLGICAGAFAAVGTDTYSNTTAYYGFAVAKGNWLVHWYPGGNSSLLTSPQSIKFPNGSSRYMIWWDGPATPAWSGGVVARYPDGIPAISQTWTNKGFVIVSGVHPEAPTSWYTTSGTDPDGTDFSYAAQLIRAALNRTPLPTF